MTGDNKGRPKRKVPLPRKLARVKRSRITSELESMPTDQLQLLAAENIDDLRHHTARAILNKRSITEQVAKPSRKRVRITKRRFLMESASYVGSLDVEQLPSGASKYLPEWLNRFDDLELQGLEGDAKAAPVRKIARAILASRLDKLQKRTLIAQFSRCSIEELVVIVERHETAFRIAADILKEKIHESLVNLTTEELKQISERGSTPLISKVAKDIYSSRKEAPGAGVDLWREQH